MTVLTADLPTATTSRVEQVAAIATVAILSVVGAGIHLYVAPEHFEEWWAFGWFFLVVAAAQVATALLVLWGRALMLIVAAIVANAGTVLVWVVSRTDGLPIGPPVLDMTGGLADPTKGGYGTHAVGLPEPVGVLDLTATVCELLVLAALCALLPRAWRRPVVDGVLVVGLLLWGLFLVGVL